MLMAYVETFALELYCDFKLAIKRFKNSGDLQRNIKQHLNSAFSKGFRNHFRYRILEPRGKHYIQTRRAAKDTKIEIDAYRKNKRSIEASSP